MVGFLTCQIASKGLPDGTQPSVAPLGKLLGVARPPPVLLVSPARAELAAGATAAAASAWRKEERSRCSSLGFQPAANAFISKILLCLTRVCLGTKVVLVLLRLA
jgi:hypothetical protein